MWEAPAPALRQQPGSPPLAPGEVSARARPPRRLGPPRPRQLCWTALARAQVPARVPAAPLCAPLAAAVLAEARREARAALAQLPALAAAPPLACLQTNQALKPKGGAVFVALLRPDAYPHLSFCCLLKRHGVHLQPEWRHCSLLLHHDAQLHG